MTHPDRVRRLVLESGSPGLDDEVERDARVEADGALAERILRGGVDGFVLEWETLPLFASQVRLPADVRERQRARRRANDPRSLAMSLLGLGTGALPSLWGRLAEVRAPTLLVVGAEDRKFVEIARAMADRLPDAQVVEIAEAGHAVHLERPDAWAEVVGSFLAG